MPTRILVLALLGLAACGGGKVNDEDDARYAYLGLDGMIDKAMNLGFQGFNAASSANIDDQTGSGDVAGSIVVGGQVDQGSSDNKQMRLSVSLAGYQDDVQDDNGDAIETIYDTNAPDQLLELDLSLKNIPSSSSDANGTLDGTLVGGVIMSNDLEGEIDLNLTITGEIAADDSGAVSRVEGSTTVTGTAHSDYGDYDVNVTK